MSTEDILYSPQQTPFDCYDPSSIYAGTWIRSILKRTVANYIFINYMFYGLALKHLNLEHAYIFSSHEVTSLQWLTVSIALLFKTSDSMWTVLYRRYSSMLSKFYMHHGDMAQHVLDINN